MSLQEAGRLYSEEKMSSRDYADFCLMLSVKARKEFLMDYWFFIKHK